MKKIRITQHNARTKLIAVIPVGIMNTWWEIVHKGAEKAANDLNVKITWNGPEIDTDRERQIQVVNSVVVILLRKRNYNGNVNWNFIN